MLSILIPIYCYEVGSLVRTLHEQARQLSIDWEICLLDDASPEEWQAKNRTLDELERVHYQELPKNVGRAKIRNLLAERARFPYLLFLDSDSGIEKEDFLAEYVRALRPERVICGGRNYEPQPRAPEYHLHWWYGSQREVRPAAARNLTPHAGFMTNNFVAPKAILRALPFDETILTYGHEDTLFGHRLELADIEVLHIDNPVVHIGLDEASVWLRKQRQAIENLYRLRQQHPALATKALRWWLRLKRVGFNRPVIYIIRSQAASLERYLLEKQKPDLRYLDLLKLLWLENAQQKSG